MSDETRRRFGRFDRALRVELEGNGATVVGETVNLGLGGLLVSVEHDFQFGDEVTVRLTVPSPEQALEAGATVRWSRTMAPGSLGLAFSALRPIDVWALLQYFNLSSPTGEGAAPV